MPLGTRRVAELVDQLVIGTLMPRGTTQLAQLKELRTRYKDRSECLVNTREA